jgi:hypothetical protein
LDLISRVIDAISPQQRVELAYVLITELIRTRRFEVLRKLLEG